MGLKSTLRTNAGGVKKHIDTAYDNIKKVADNLEALLSLEKTFDTINGVYLGEYTSNPTTRPDSSALVNGDHYLNTQDRLLYVYVDGNWSFHAIFYTENGLLEAISNSPFYTWLAYADDLLGNGISTDPTGKAYLGIASNQITPDVSILDEDVFVWNRMQGLDGRDSQLHIAYADSPDGTANFNYVSGTYLGIYSDFIVADSTNPVDYNWSLIKGTDGDTPAKGVDYFDGEDGNFVSFVFKTQEAEPVAPTGGSFDGTTETVPAGWSDDPVQPTSDTEIIWVSKGIYKVTNGSYETPTWGSPTKFFQKGDKPVYGVDYTTADGAYVSFIFYNSETPPTTPTGGSYNGTTEDIPLGWGDNPATPTGNEITWVAKTTYVNDGTSWSAPSWSTPAKFYERGADAPTPVKGIDYFDGLNGQYTSFIFKNDDPQAVVPAPTGGAFDGTNETIPTGWTDDVTYPAVGQVTLVSKGIYRHDGTDWINTGWSDPSLFYQKGDKPVQGVDYTTIDGSFISFVFKNAVTNPGLPTGGSYDGTNEVIPTGWTDDPVATVGDEITWVSKAKYQDDGTNWSNLGWSATTKFFEKGADGANGLDGNDGADGYTPIKGVDYFDGTDGVNGSYTSYIFINAVSAPATPTGGSFDGSSETLPTSWGDNPVTPAAGETTWVSVYRYTHNGTVWSTPIWSTPAKFYEKGEEGATGPQGEQGIQGIQGLTGVAGSDGADGTSTYFHVAYANSADGSVGFNQTTGEYIGTYVDSNPVDSGNYLDYDWVLIKGAQGEDGTQGIPGTNGADGQTSYLHIAYADSADGSVNFNQVSGDYLGQYVDFVVTDSVNPNDYNWSLIKGGVGPKGDQGDVGAVGPSGADGVNGQRGTKHYYTTVINGAWSDVVADAAISAEGDTKQGWDIVTISDAANGFSETRFWDLSQAPDAWTKIDQVIDGSLLVNGTVSANKIQANSITSALIAANTITAGEIDVDALFAENITLTGTFKAIGTNYTVLIDGNNAESPLSINSSGTNDLVFGFDNSDRLFIDAGFAPNTVDSLNVFTPEVLAQLIPEVEGSTGGSTFMVLPNTLSGVAANIDILGLNPANASSVTVAFSITDGGVAIGDAGYVAPQWSVSIRRRINSGTWSAVIYSTTYTGYANYTPIDDLSDFGLSINDSFVDTPTSNSGDNLEYEITLTRVTGSYTNPRYTAASVAQQILGGGAAGAATTLDGLDSTDFVRTTGDATETITGTKTFTSRVAVQAAVDSPLRFNRPAASANEWNYMEWYGTAGTRLAYLGVDSAGNAIWNRTNGASIDLTTTAANISKTTNVTGDLTATGKIIAGYNGNNQVLARHVNGKNGISNTEDALYLNHSNGFPVYINGNIALTAGNITGYSPNSNLSDYTGDLNSWFERGNRRVNSTSTNTPEAGSFFAAMTYGNNGNVTGQLATDFVTGETSVRGYNSSWSVWRTLWDSENFNPSAQTGIDTLTFTSGSSLRDYGNGVDVQSATSSTGIRLKTSEGTQRGFVWADATSVGFLNNSGSWRLQLNNSGIGELRGSTTGNANISILGFNQSDGTRDGYVGVGSTGNRNVYAVSDAAEVVVNGATGVQLQYNGTIKFAARGTLNYSYQNLDMQGNDILDAGQIAIGEGVRLTDNDSSYIETLQTPVLTRGGDNLQVIPYINSATYSNGLGGQTGAIAIKLPTATFNGGAMLRFVVDIYDYSSNRTCSFIIGGYQYQVGNEWLSETATQIGGSRKYNVTFGSEANRAVVYIGDITTVWDYPKVVVRDVQIGFANTGDSWRTGWTIGLEATTLQNVERTITPMNYLGTASLGQGEVLWFDGGSNTYVQSHAEDQWRVVTGGVERLEVNTTGINVAGNISVTGTVDGRDIAADGATLDAIPSNYIAATGAETRSGNLELWSTDGTGNYANAAIELRELNQAGAGTGIDAHAPALTWHWGGRHTGQIALHADGIFHFRDGVTHNSYKGVRASQFHLSDDARSYFWTDATNRITTSADFYIRADSGNTYLYSTNTYLGSTSGDTILFRGNTVTADNWGITGAGAITAVSFSGSGASLTNLSAGNITGTLAAARLPTKSVPERATSLGSGVDLDTLGNGLSDAGFYYQTSNAQAAAGSNWPADIAGSLLVMPSASSSGFGNTQLYIGYNSEEVYVRSLYGPDTNRPWTRMFSDTYHPNADQWTTSRTLTVGNTGKSVNGTGNVSWTLPEIGAVALGARSDGYVWIRRSSTATALYVTNQSTGHIAAFYSGAGDGTLRSYIDNSGVIYAPDYSVTSDRRVKTDLVKLRGSLDKLDRLQGYTFTRTDMNDKRHAGTIAQDWREVLPESVNEDEDGKLSVSAQAQIGLLVEAIKELKREVEELKRGNV